MANQMWGGRFDASPDALMDAINVCIDFDKSMAAQDLMGSRAHVHMLRAQHIITDEVAGSILQGLTQVEEELKAGTFTFHRHLEDIHMNIEGRLREIVGDAAGFVHTARSRNDQVATDFRLWIRDQIDDLVLAIHELQGALARQALAHFDVAMPGYTHLQTAQPVTFGHHLLAYVEMLERDRGRFLDARRRLNESPLGASALAGTSFPIDRFMTAETLHFDRPMANSLDAVSSRDFALEALAAAAISAMHLSRFAEEIIIWMSSEFRFITLPDNFATGSSIMPQKKNPDAAELIRAKVGRITGAFVALLIVMKGVPLAYAKDMQEDKEQVFDALPNMILSYKVMAGMVGGLEPQVKNMRAALDQGHPTATDLADWLVQNLDMPFRDAHHVSGRAVALAENKGVQVAALTLEALQSIEPRITEAVFDVLGVEHSLNSRISYGGTAPRNVRDAAQAWLEILEGRV